MSHGSAASRFQDTGCNANPSYGNRARRSCSNAKNPSASTVSSSVTLAGDPVRRHRSITVRPRLGPGPRSTQAGAVARSEQVGSDQPCDRARIVQRRTRATEARPQRHRCLDVAQRAHAVPRPRVAQRREPCRRAQCLGGQFQCRQNHRPAARQYHGERFWVVEGVELGGGRGVAFAPGAGHQHDALDLRGQRRLGHQRERQVGDRGNADQGHRPGMSRRMPRMASAAMPGAGSPPAGNAMPPRPSTPCTRVSLTKAPSSGRSAPP